MADITRVLPMTANALSYRRGIGEARSPCFQFQSRFVHPAKLASPGRPAIRHLLEPCASHVLQKQAADVPDATDTDVTLRGLVWVGLQPIDKTFQIVCRKVFPRHNKRKTI